MDLQAVAEKRNWRRVAKRIRVPLGFAFSAVFLLLARPTRRSLGGSLLVVLPGLALRGYASGYVKKNAELTVSGPYAYTRNPLYLGSMLIAFGFAAGARSRLSAILLTALFAVIYVPVIQGEEQYLREHFAEFEDYARRVPRLLPWRLPEWSVAHMPGRFGAALYLKHREYNASMGVAALYCTLILRLSLAPGR